MSIDLITLIPIFFIIALLYSSAGFGGGSSYLAVLALSAIPFEEFRMIALLCNIAVVSGSVWIFYKSGYLQFRKIWPLVILSVPMAYLGGQMSVSEDVFLLLLGCTLLIAGILMLVSKTEGTRQLPLYTNGIIGGGIGLLSGIVGIGGGIFLSPLLNLSRWADAKVIAGTTAFFILVNSTAGFIGQVVTHGFHLELAKLSLLIIAVIVGGQLGARYSAGRLDQGLVKKITAILIIIVAIRILYDYQY